MLGPSKSVKEFGQNSGFAQTVVRSGSLDDAFDTGTAFSSLRMLKLLSRKDISDSK